MVPGLVGGNDDVQRWTAELMAKGRPRFCPGAGVQRQGVTEVAEADGKLLSRTGTSMELRKNS